MKSKIIITRKELYENVWSKPLTHIAKEYGISDVAINKICQKLNVPTPGAGYWTKIRHGKRPPIIPLSLEGGSFKNIYTLDSMQSKKKLLTPVYPKDYKRIKVHNKLNNPHPIVLTTLEKHKGNYNVKGESLFLNVSRDCYNRALRIMDALVKAVELRGFRIKRHFVREMCIALNDVELVFRLYEQKKKVANPDSRTSCSFVLTGNLVLTLPEHFPNVPLKTRFADNEKNKLEYQLDDFLFNAMEAFKIKKVQHDIWQAELEKKRNLQRIAEQEELRLRREREKQEHRVHQFEKLARNYNKAVMLNNFIKAIEQQPFSVEELQSISSWVVWARKYIQQIDPFQSGALIKSILAFEEAEIP